MSTILIIERTDVKHLSRTFKKGIYLEGIFSKAHSHSATVTKLGSCEPIMRWKSLSLSHHANTPIDRIITCYLCRSQGQPWSHHVNGP